MGVVIAVGTGPLGLVDDAVLVQIHNVYLILEVGVRLGIGIWIDMSVVEAGLEILTWTEVEPKGQRNCCTTNFPGMFGKHKNTLLFRAEQVSDACLG